MRLLHSPGLVPCYISAQRVAWLNATIPRTTFSMRSPACGHWAERWALLPLDTTFLTFFGDYAASLAGGGETNDRHLCQ